MTDPTTPTRRSGHSNAPQGAERARSLIILIEDRPGAVDRVIGLLRRRRANMQTLVLGRSEASDTVRITVVVNDSEVGVEHLVAQLHKVADVRHLVNLAFEQAVTRELALVKVSCTLDNFKEIIELGQLFGAYAVDITATTVTLEVAGSEEKVERLVNLLQEYGIREIARSGRVAITRGEDDMQTHP